MIIADDILNEYIPRDHFPKYHNDDKYPSNMYLILYWRAYIEEIPLSLESRILHQSTFSAESDALGTLASLTYYNRMYTIGSVVRRTLILEFSRCPSGENSLLLTSESAAFSITGTIIL